MARMVSMVLTDDMDGSAADETVAFSLDGVSYELDLNSKNAAAMRLAFDAYASAGRRLGGSAGRVLPRAEQRPFDAVDPKAVRAWAASNQVPVSPRGRIPAAVLAGFRAAGH